MFPCILAFTSFYSCILDAACGILYPGLAIWMLDTGPRIKIFTLHLACNLDPGSPRGAPMPPIYLQMPPRYLQMPPRCPYAAKCSPYAAKCNPNALPMQLNAAPMQPLCSPCAALCSP